MGAALVVVMGEPLLSVVLPVRNGANYLAAALESVLVQTSSDFVVHISDNASDDGTADILADYASRDPRFKVSRSAAPLTQVANMNRAVALAQTPWVRMLCHDDLLRPDCIARTLAAVRSVNDSRIALIGNDERHLFANGYLTPTKADGPLESYFGRAVPAANLFGRGISITIPSVTTATVRRRALDELGGFDPRFAHFDIFAWYRLLMRWDYAWLPAQLTVNRIHGRQVAVDARAALRSVFDYRTFLAEFANEFGTSLALGPIERLRGRLVPLGIAATTIAVEIRTGRAARVRHALKTLPSTWLPLLFPLTLRALIVEQQRLKQLHPHVPARLIYP
jgi:glycosyltransferase involved in cell wall biosynthesis